MTVQLEMWQLIVLLLAFFGAVWTFGKVLLDQFEKRLGERFKAQETLRQAGQAQWEKRLNELEKISRDTEREVLTLKADLPLNYVRREDYIRGQSVIEAKLDALYSELKLVQLNGAKHGG